MQSDKKLYAVRMTYQGHSTNCVMSAAHRTTMENRAACVRALAALEGVTEQEMEIILSRNVEYLKVELYTVSG
jgi:hypothetical protein